MTFDETSTGVGSIESVSDEQFAVIVDRLDRGLPVRFESADPEARVIQAEWIEALIDRLTGAAPFERWSSRIGRVRSTRADRNRATHG